MRIRGPGVAALVLALVAGCSHPGAPARSPVAPPPTPMTTIDTPFYSFAVPKDWVVKPVDETALRIFAPGTAQLWISKGSTDDSADAVLATISDTPTTTFDEPVSVQMGPL